MKLTNAWALCGLLVLGSGVVLANCVDDSCLLTLTCPTSGSGAAGQAGQAGAGGGILANGEACSAAAHCESGFCVDGVCCESACDGLCEACDLMGATGACTPNENGTDPDNDCNQTKCDGSGSCVHAEHLWSVELGGKSPPLIGSSALRLASDQSGNVVLAGSFDGTMTVGSTSLVSQGSDIVVARFSKSGNPLLARRFGDAAAQRVEGVALDGAGDIIITGYMSGTMNLGFGCSPLSGPASYLAKLPSTGSACIWAKTLAASTSGVAVDATGNIIVAGSFTGDVSLGGSTLSSSVTDTFVVKFDPDGNHIWSKQSTGGSAASVVAVGSDRIAIGGYFGFGGAVNFGGGILMPSSSSNDMFVASYYASTGAHAWSVGVGATDGTFGPDEISVDAMKSVTVVGAFSGTLDFGAATITADNIDGFAAHFDAAGEHRWSTAVGGPNQDWLFSVKNDSQGNVIMTGYVFDSADLGGRMLVASNPLDMLVAKLDVNGNHVWSKLYSDMGPHGGLALAVGPSDEIAIATESMTTDSIDLGGGPLSNGFILGVLGP